MAMMADPCEGLDLDWSRDYEPFSRAFPPPPQLRVSEKKRTISSSAFQRDWDDIPTGTQKNLIRRANEEFRKERRRRQANAAPGGGGGDETEENGQRRSILHRRGGRGGNAATEEQTELSSPKSTSSDKSASKKLRFPSPSKDDIVGGLREVGKNFVEVTKAFACLGGKVDEHSRQLSDHDGRINSNTERSKSNKAAISRLERSLKKVLPKLSLTPKAKGEDEKDEDENLRRLEVDPDDHVSPAASPSGGAVPAAGTSGTFDSSIQDTEDVVQGEDEDEDEDYESGSLPRTDGSGHEPTVGGNCGNEEPNTTSTTTAASSTSSWVKYFLRK